MRLKKSGKCITNGCNNKRAQTGYHSDGEPRYVRLCDICRKRAYDKNSFYWKKENKDDVCVKCGFEAEQACQLDIDHIIPLFEGGSTDKENTQTLCANCHRLKTFKEQKRAGFHFTKTQL